MKAVELIDSTCRHFLGWVSTKGTFINDVIFKKGLMVLKIGRNSITYSPLFLNQTLRFVKLFWNYCEIWPGCWNLVKNWIEWFKFDSFLWHLNKTLVETWILSDLYGLEIWVYSQSLIVWIIKLFQIHTVQYLDLWRFVLRGLLWHAFKEIWFTYWKMLK